ncbi:MAG: bifunctional methylenetetrahydrofolate dehydrogenase/methenyltetrahydrofolate cyclohydrolase FolD [Deltaproteobacteria bacterium]|nr:bifunctional methylenetetrahydrofolate dehydrogenase/methenyltetrahydrofolate cyclohydrolase FolD [Deltaproteobacteria bacterium]
MACLDGKRLADRVREGLAAEIERITAARGRPPSLHVVLVGDDPASQIYVRNKKKACEKAGIFSHEHRLPATTPQREVVDLVARLNADPKVDGFLVQTPVPRHIDPAAIVRAVDPAKDVDGYHPVNLGLLMAGKPGLRPCTPAGCMLLIDETGIDLIGKHAVVVGRSLTVGKPMALMLLERHATVTICHSRTEDLGAVVARADVLVAAVGRPRMIRGEWVKPGAVVIDVGINRLTDGGMAGDVEFDFAEKRAAFITPVPGGVGPMTVACLLANTVEVARSGIPR